MNQLISLYPRITEALGSLPAALQAAADGEPQPLAVGTREALVDRLEASGMPGTDARKLASQVLGGLSRTDRYLTALATDHAVRVDLDGVDAEPVSSADRLVASNMLLIREMRHARRDGSQKGKPKASAVAPAPAPTKSASFASGTLTLPAARRAR